MVDQDTVQQIAHKHNDVDVVDDVGDGVDDVADVEEGQSVVVELIILVGLEEGGDSGNHVGLDC